MTPTTLVEFLVENPVDGPLTILTSLTSLVGNRRRTRVWPLAASFDVPLPTYILIDEPLCSDMPLLPLILMEGTPLSILDVDRLVPLTSRVMLNAPWLILSPTVECRLAMAMFPSTPVLLDTHTTPQRRPAPEDATLNPCALAPQFMNASLRAQWLPVSFRTPKPFMVLATLLSINPLAVAREIPMPIKSRGLEPCPLRIPFPISFRVYFVVA